MILLCAYLMSTSLEALGQEDNLNCHLVPSAGQKATVEKLIIIRLWFKKKKKKGTKLFVSCPASVSMEIKLLFCILTLLRGIVRLCLSFGSCQYFNASVLVQHFLKLIKTMKSDYFYISYMFYITKLFSSATNLVICLTQDFMLRKHLL